VLVETVQKWMWLEVGGGMVNIIMFYSTHNDKLCGENENTCLVISNGMSQSEQRGQQTELESCDEPRGR
jgi:hypothetical protein